LTVYIFWFKLLRKSWATRFFFIGIQKRERERNKKKKNNNNKIFMLSFN